jgi:tight adherence protein C
MSQLDWLRIAACATGAGALFTIGYVAAATAAPQGKRLGLRGLKRQRALEKLPLWSTLEPLVRWIGGRFSGFVSDAWRQRINRKLTLAGDYLGLLPEETIGLGMLSTLLGLAVGMVLGSLSGMGNLVVIACALVGAAMPYLRISGGAAKRMKDVDRRLPYAIDLLALAMGAGLDFPGSVRQVVEKSGHPDEPVIEELTLILQSLQLGRTRQQALEEFAERVPADSVIEFVGSVVQAELRGNPIVEVLRIQAEVSRRKRSVFAEESAAKAGVAMIVPMVLVFFTILILIVAPIVMRLRATEV